MPKASPILLSFNAGELSPSADGRIDLEKYKKGCRILENYIPKIQGVAEKRPGTRFVSEVKDSSKKVRLIPFTFNTSQAYILEFGDLYMRVCKDGGQVLSGGSPYEITTPYSHTDLFQLRFAQSADVMYIVHPSYKPQKLTRSGHTSWSMSDVNFDWVAFNSENITATTITSSATTGSVTLTASSSLFIANHVGTNIKISEVISSKYDKWETGKTISSGAYRQYSNILYRASSGGTTGNRPPIHTKGTESDGGVNWDYVHDGAGYATITAYSDATHVTATVVKEYPASSTLGSDRWSFGAWSSEQGYPKSVTFYEDRLWFGGTVERPQTLWGSVAGDYENFKTGTKDDDSVTYTINTDQVNGIEWLSAGKVLVIGTSGGQFIASASSTNKAITPTDVRIIKQSTYGASSNQPIRISSSVLFVQRSGQKVRDFVYDFNTDSYVASDMNIIANHILVGGINDISYQQDLNQIVWMARNDGQLIGFTYEKAEQVIAWHRHILGGNGFVESVATIVHWDGEQDSTWLVVKRTINGATKRYIEYIEKDSATGGDFFVDSGLSYNGAPTSTISGLTHLEGETVRILSDGAVHPDRVVSGGAITLQSEGSVINVGLGYDAKLSPMRLEAGAADGVAQGKNKRITNTVLRLLNTGAGLFIGNGTKEDELFLRTSNDLMDNPIPLFTGNTDITPFQGVYDQDGIIEITHKSPLPCTIVAIMPQVVTYDR